MALGLRLARPGRRIVQVIGDGGFHFSSPDSVYAVAQQYEIPIFTVVLDNGGWQAVKSATQRVYPKGVAADTDQFQSRLMSGRQGERRDFSAVAKAFGAHVEKRCLVEAAGFLLPNIGSVVIRVQQLEQVMAYGFAHVMFAEVFGQKPEDPRQHPAFC